MITSCPHCNTTLDIPQAYYGQSLSCPACGGKLTVNAPTGDQKNEQTGKVDRPGWHEKDQMNPNIGASFGIAIVITACFLISMVPLQDNLGAIFLKRGWVNYAETLLFFWGIVILIMKYRMNRRQHRAAMLELFPMSIDKEITRKSVSKFIDYIYKTPMNLRDSIIINRIRKALELFESKPNNSEVSTFLATQSDLDASRSYGSYALIKVFLWAIPILGFIGTVMGLSTAVGSLDLTGDIKNSIGALTGGLGTAFDTTLLGLILSILLSFPLAAIQKSEDETLTVIDAYCNERVLPKLNDAKYGTTDELLQQAENMPEMVRSLAKAHETFIDKLNGSTLQLKETSEFIKRTLTDHHGALNHSFAERSVPFAS